MESAPRVRSLNGAAGFVDRVGIALVFPKDDLVLPSLWEAIAGAREVEWAVRDTAGTFLSFTPEMDRLWRWKDGLPAERLACAGRHLARVVSLVSPTLVSSLYVRTERDGRADDFRAAGLSSLQLEIAEAVLENGPCCGPEIRMLLGTSDKRGVDAGLQSLQRLLVLTHAGIVEQEHGWPAIRLDLFARQWRTQLRRLPSADDARRRLAATVLQSAGDVSAADLGAALGWRRREAAVTLAELEETGAAASHDEAGIKVWSPRGAFRDA